MVEYRCVGLCRYCGFDPSGVLANGKIIIIGISSEPHYNFKLTTGRCVTRNKIIITALIVIAVFGCAVLIFHKPVQTWRLPDGSELSLAKVTYGKKHEMAYGNRWRDFLYPVLPAGLRTKLGCNGVTRTTADPAVVVWFWLKNHPSPGIPPSGLPSPTPQYHLMIVDENGNESRFPFGEIGLGSGQYISTRGLELDNWNFSAHSETIKIRIYATER